MKYHFSVLLIALFLSLKMSVAAASVDENSAENEIRPLSDYLIRHWETRDGLVEDMKITVSIGVASSYDYADHSSLLVAADKALYQAKSEGRNRVESKP